MTEKPCPLDYCARCERQERLRAERSTSVTARAMHRELAERCRGLLSRHRYREADPRH